MKKTNAKKEKLKKHSNKGITLIALVITIIVLLILAGVSIAMLTGENGVLTKATEAKEQTEVAQEKEEIQMAYAASKANKVDQVADDVTASELQGELTKLNSLGTVDDSDGLKVSYPNGHVYTIDQETGKITGTEEVEESSLITFTINFYDFFGTLTQETVCKAEEGMTWEEWVNSEYNNINCYIKDNYIYTGNSIGHNYTHVILYKIDANTGEPDMSNEIYSQFEIEENQNYYGMHNPAECVYPDSEILIDADGKTTVAKEIKENDSIAYYDFNENVVKIGKVSKVYVHKEATNFVKYTFEDESYLQATDYHPIYTKEGWKSLTNRNGYEKPEEGDLVKTEEGWKKLTNIEEYTGKEDCYDFEIVSETGIKVDNYFANGTLVQGSY